MNRFTTLIAALVVASSAACSMSADEEILEPSAELIDRSSGALSMGKLAWIDGTYSATCKNPATGAAHLASDGWSLRIAGSNPMTNAPLKVTKGDSDCVLTLTGVGTTDGVYIAAPKFAMTTSYQPSASEFALSGGPTAFYANAKMSSSSMASNFVVSLIFSDDLSAVSGGTKTGSYAQFSGAIDPTAVPAPYYTAENTIAIEANDDDTVSSTTGSFVLTEASQPGDHYVLIDGAIADMDFAKVDAAYKAAIPMAITGPSIALESSAVLPNGVSLPAQRTIIVERTVDGVAAYQVFTLAFSPPPSAS